MTMTAAEMAAALNAIGALFHLDPADPKLRPVLEALGDDEAVADWPGPRERVAPALAAMAAVAAGGDDGRAALHDAFRDLFVGPAPLPAPPWGSVYLDEEKVLFGSSTVALRTFLQQQAITLAGLDNAPEDQFGTLCWIGAWLAAEGRVSVLDELMSEHVLPWAFLYLDELRAAALTLAQDNPAAGFYAAAADLATATLGILRDERHLTVVAKKLYPNRPAMS
jgi:TorA maturation chaperone TorD